MGTNKIPTPEVGFKNVLITILGDWWELKEHSETIQPGDPRYNSAQKAIRSYFEVYKKVNKLKAKILEWNRKHPNNQFPSIEEVAKLPIRK